MVRPVQRGDSAGHWTESTLVSGTLMPPHIVDLNDWQGDEWPARPTARLAEEVKVVRFQSQVIRFAG